MLQAWTQKSKTQVRGRTRISTYWTGSYSGPPGLGKWTLCVPEKYRNKNDHSLTIEMMHEFHLIIRLNILCESAFVSNFSEANKNLRGRL